MASQVLEDSGSVQSTARDEFMVALRQVLEGAHGSLRGPVEDLARIARELVVKEDAIRKYVAGKSLPSSDKIEYLLNALTMLQVDASDDRATAQARLDLKARLRSLWSRGGGGTRKRRVAVSAPEAGPAPMLDLMAMLRHVAPARLSPKLLLDGEDSPESLAAIDDDDEPDDESVPPIDVVSTDKVAFALATSRGSRLFVACHSGADEWQQIAPGRRHHGVAADAHERVPVAGGKPISFVGSLGEHIFLFIETSASHPLGRPFGQSTRGKLRPDELRAITLDLQHPDIGRWRWGAVRVQVRPA